MGTVRVCFFAYLKEKVGVEEIKLDIPDPSSLKQLLLALEATIPSTRRITENNVFRIAVNQEMVEKDSAVIKTGDEIAFLPPFSGG